MKNFKSVLKNRNQINIWTTDEFLAMLLSLNILANSSSEVLNDNAKKILVLTLDSDFYVTIEEIMESSPHKLWLEVVNLEKFHLDSELENEEDSLIDFKKLEDYFNINEFDIIYYNNFDLRYWDSIHLSNFLNKKRINQFRVLDDDISLNDLDKNDVSIQCNDDSVVIHYIKGFNRLESELFKLENLTF